MSKLAQKALNGVLWSSVQRFGTMIITFVSNIILARLLTPNDYGCVGMLMIFISLSNTFIDGGFGSALIQKKNPTEIDYSTIFYLNIILSIILYCVLFLSAPYIAEFYRIPLLKSILRVQGIVLFFNAFSIIQQNQLRKKLDFKRLSIVNISSAIISLIIAIIMAYKGFGVWSLVAQQLSIGLFNAIFFWVVSKWRPLKAFSFQSFKQLFNFGGFIFLSHLISTFSNEFQGLLVGRKFNADDMGLYTQAYRLEGSSATAISSIIDQVTYPILSSLQDDKERLKAALKKFIQIPSFICCPLMGLMIIIAKPLVVFLYTEKWVDCVPYFQILCCAGVAVCLQGAANNAIAAIGKSKVFFKFTIFKRLLTILLCIVGIYLNGMIGLMWGVVAGAWSVYLVNAFLVHKHIGYSFISQIKDILPFIGIALITGLFVYSFSYLITKSVFICVITQIFGFLGIYLILSKLLKINILDYICVLIRDRLSNSKVNY